MCLLVGSRPDKPHGTSVLSQFNYCFGSSRWQTAKHALLSYALLLGTTFGPRGDSLAGYVDVDWVVCIDDRMHRVYFHDE